MTSFFDQTNNLFSKDRNAFPFIPKAIKAIFVVVLGLITISLCGCVTNSEPPKLASSNVSSSVVKEEGTLKVGVNTSLSPMAGTGNSKIIGIDVDIAGAIADEMGLKLEVVDTGTNPAKALANNTVDVVLGIDSSGCPANAKLTDQYLTTGVAYFAKSGSSATAPQSNDSKKIAVQASSKSAWTSSSVFGTDKIVTCDDLESAFQSLSKGSVQYVAADAIVGLYAANKAGLDVEIVAAVDGSEGYCAAVKTDRTDTYSAIQDALTKVKSKGIINVIQKKWLGKEISLSGVTKINAGSSVSPTDTSSETASSSSSSSQNSSSSGSTASATDASTVTGSSSKTN